MPVNPQDLPPLVPRSFRIMAVEDSPLFQAMVKECLSQDYDLQVFSTAEAAERYAAKERFDLCLLDVMLPGKNGFQLLQALRTMPGYHDVPMIMMTSLETIDHKKTAFAAGANDYIIKPYEPEEVRMRVRMHLQVAANKVYLQTQKYFLEQQVRLQNQRLIKTLNASIAALAALAETRDNETGGHIHRTMRYMDILARLAQGNAGTEEEFQGIDVDTLVKSAPLHDIGKVGIPDSILLKPGALTDQEMDVMRTHTTLGAQTIAKAEQEAGESDFLQHARKLCLTHHEKWDGSGYPQGLSGRAIPIEGRLMAICDVYDALISRRAYKPAYSHRKALGIMAQGRIRHFDPRLLDLFLKEEQQFCDVALAHADSEEEAEILLSGEP